MRFYCLATAFLFLATGVTSAGLVLTYTGPAYSTTTGAFTTNDFITGTATFANPGDTSATAVSLTTTVGGGPGYSLDATAL
ncbi:MAG: hypothetical protein KDB27_02045 [Planctomycetales bacterium]|nr:hypothetical protein [Planctomycetales bacterium]